MPDFASILANVERNAAEYDAPRAFSATSSLRARVSEAQVCIPPNRRAALDAYAAERAPQDLRNTPTPDLEALRHAIAAAGRDAKRLRALRRHAAHALHPDRGGDSDALAECNALIDAALRTASRKRT
ncbi:MAG: hypothetical protein KDJ25_18025 [Rhodoblastus sp.]|nr:hypothetical protein [Rhodoblastus sp.]